MVSSIFYYREHNPEYFLGSTLNIQPVTSCDVGKSFNFSESQFLIHKTRGQGWISVFYKMLVPGYSNLGPGHQCFQKAPGVIELRAVLLKLECVYKLLRIVLKSDSIFCRFGVVLDTLHF